MKRIAMIPAAITVLLMAACGMNPAGDGSDDGSYSEANQAGDGLYEIVATSIDDGSTDVRLDEEIEMEFPRTVERGGANEESVFIVDVAKAESEIKSSDKEAFFAGICDPRMAVPSVIGTYDRINFVLKPDEELKEDTIYALCITDSIRYQDGDFFPGMVLSFKTMIRKKVAVAMTSPANREDNVDMLTAVKVIFDGRIDLSTMNDENFEVVSEEGEEINGMLTYRSSSPVTYLTFEPDDSLRSGMRYFVRMAGAIEDDEGVCLAGENDDGDCDEFVYEWSFVTAE